MNMKTLCFLIIAVCFCQSSIGQSLDRDLYLKLLKADSSQFIRYTKDLGFEITITPAALYARSAHFRFEKPLLMKTFGWKTLLVVSSKDKANNKVIYQKARRLKRHKESLVHKKYLYVESQMNMQATDETWYTVRVLRS
ncbi:MAG: hypothetical protein JWQ27_370 [Ferruginibacter sp.]|nr:hypothetical protein [Ferruginibacter sp.]